MIDTHCHIQTEQFDSDREQVIADAMAAGVEGFIVPAIDLASFDATLDIARTHTNVWCGLGIHPHSSAQWNDDVRSRIKDEIAKNSKVVAIGEIGLDYYNDFAPRETELKAFREQIELAIELDKPIIIHTRDSIDETIEIVSEYYGNKSQTSGFGQFHCFSGSPEQAERVASLGFAVSFTGNITFKNSSLAETVLATPLSSILIETDSPYLAPVPYRGKRNMPAYVPLVAKKIAELKQRDITEIMQITTENAKRIFRLASVAIVLLAGLLCTSSERAQAQTGSRPPDSVMTKDRREAEEMIRRQREELGREQEKRRQDSIRSAQQEDLEIQQEMRDQSRKDSIKTAERIRDEERSRLKAQTPIAWKAIGIGGGIGIGNLSELSQGFRRTLVPTSVLATSIQIGTQISRVIDFEFSYNTFTVSDNLTPDNLYRSGDSSALAQFDALHPPVKPYFVPTQESIKTTYLSFDLRFVINPRSPLKFYTGLGYNYVTITNSQDYFKVDSVTGKSASLSVTNSFNRGGIKVLFGARYDFELGSNFIVTPFAQIGASFLFNNPSQVEQRIYDFQVPADLITFTHLKVGATVYFGWFGIKRYQ